MLKAKTQEEQSNSKLLVDSFWDDKKKKIRLSTTLLSYRRAKPKTSIEDGTSDEYIAVERE